MDWLFHLLMWFNEVEKLGSLSFKQREAANGKLAANIDHAIIALHFGEKHKDPEIACRCKLLVDQWYKRHAAKLANRLIPNGWDDLPWIDPNILSYGCGQHYLALADKTGRKFENTPKYERWSFAMRLYLIDLIAARQPTAETIQLACDEHRAWCKAHGLHVPP